MKNIFITFKVFSILVILLFMSASAWSATKTWVPTAGGAWSTAANWSPSGAPAANDDVIINSNQSAAITAVPTISLTSLTVSGNCNLVPSAAGNTLTVTGTFSVSAGITFSLGTNGSNTRLNMTLGSACVGSILGTVNVYTSTTNAIFTNNGDLTLGSAALITDGGGANNSDFMLSATGILRIGSAYGISTGTTQGATVGNIQVTGTRTYTAGADYVYNGIAAQLTGSGLTQNTPGTLIINNSAGVTLSAATTISGLLTMTTGTLNMANTNLTIGSLTGSGDITNTTGTAGSRTFTIGSDNSSPAAFTGTINNGTATQVTVTKTGTGTLTLAGTGDNVGLALSANAGTVVLGKQSNSGVHVIGGGGLTIAGGTVQLAGSGGDQIYDGCSVTINSGTFDMNGQSETIVILTGTGGSILNNGTSASTLTINSTTTNTYSGIISNGSFGNGGISIVKTGTGIQTLSGLNTYNGTTAVNGGTLKAGVATTGANGAFGNASAVTLANTTGVILDITGFNNTIGSLAGGGTTGGNVTLGAATLTTGNATNTTYAGIISGTGAVTKTGTGIWTVSGNNTFSGLTTISAGTLQLGSAGSGANTPLGTTGGATSITSGAALDLNGFTLATTEALTINGTGVSGNGAIMNSSAAAVSYSGNITLGSASSIVADNGAITLQTGTLTGVFGLTLGGFTGGTVSRVIATGTGTLIKEDAGIWTLSGLNTYTGSTTISAGIIKFGQHGAAGSGPLGTNAGGTVVANGAALDLAGFSENSTETLTLNGTGPGGAGALRNTGGADTYAGLISLGSASSINGEGETIAISNTGTITGATFGLTLGGTQGGTLSSIIGTTTGTLTKVDAGTWMLSGVNTYTGATTISDGILQLGVANAIKYGASGARSNIILSGGTFSSGSGAGFNDGTSANPMGTLQLTVSSDIILGTGSHSLYFATSNAVSWTASTMITITGWAGGYNGTTGTAGKIFVGSTSSGLTTGQLDQIQFFNGSAYYGATILSNGEIVAIQNTPVVSSQPVDLTVCEGSTATFTAQSTGGNPAPTATWQISTGGSFSNLTIASPYSVSTATVSGTTTSTLTINPTPYSYSAYQYRVIFNNSHGNAISNGATLTVNQASVGGSVTGGNTPICLGSGTGTLTLGGQTGAVTRWQSNLNSSGWTDIANTGTTYSETPASAGTWQYRAEVQSGVCTAAFSAAKTIIVNPRPTSLISGSVTICSGQSATINVALTGTAPWSLTYTDGTTPVNVNSIAASPYTFSVSPSSAKTYIITSLSDANCTAQAGDMTGSAIITINTGCQVVTLTQPSPLSAVISGSATIACGNSATITVTFSGGTSPYKVTYNGIDHTGPSPVTFSVSPTTTTTYNSANVSVTDAHSCSSSTTGSATITVTPLSAPVATDATGVTTNSFSANWNALSGATGYRLDVSTASNFSSFVTGYNDLNVLNVITYPVTGLSPGVLYYYRVRAYSSTCLSGNSNTKSVTTTSLTIGAPVVTGAPFNVNCSTSASGSITFTHGTFNTGNVFTAQLSDNTGSFASPASIGSGSDSPMNITIPANTATGTNSYKIRVVSSDPVVTGSVSSTFTIINNPCLPIYRSYQNGYWNNISTWQVSTDGGSHWAAASARPGCADGSITIRNGHTVTVNDSVTVNELTIESGGTLINKVNPLYTYYFLTVANKIETPDKPDMIVNGVLSAEDDISVRSGASISFGSGGVYQHNRTDFFIEIPAASWNTNSTCEIDACSDVAPLGLNQAFGNFNWNYPTQTATIDLNGDLTTINGDFTVSSTGAGILQLAASGNKTITVGGSTDIKYGSTVDLGTNIITGSGSFNLDAGTSLLIGSASGITASGNSGNIQVAGTRNYSTSADYTYNGSSQATGNGLPATLNNLKIDNNSDVTLTNSETCTGTLNITSGKLTVPSAKSLTVQGATALGSSECLILKSDAGGTASFIDNGTINGTGTARIERYLDPYFVVSDWKFHFLSSPVGAAQSIMPGFQTMTNTTDDFYMWNEPTNEWISTKLGYSAPFTWNTAFGTGNGAFVAGKGYLVAYPSAVTKNFVGKPYTSPAGLTMTCTHTSAPGTDVSPGWNLLGNPFPSAIDWDLVTKGSGMDAALYYYDNGPPRYRYYVALTGGIGNSFSGGSRYIPAMQGFMVHAKTTGTKTITMNNADRVHQGMNLYYKDAVLTANVLNLSVEGNGERDDARVCFYDQATMNFDGDYDAYKIFSYNNSIPELYSVTPDSTNVAINTMPVSEMYGTVQLGFMSGTAGTFTFTAEGIENFAPNVYIRLEDKKTGIIQKLNDNPVYSFTASASDDAGRFVLHFRDATGINDPVTGRDFTIYQDGTVINILSLNQVNGQVKVYDMAGRETATAIMLPNQATRIDMQGHTGVYVISVISSKGIVNTKLVVK